MGRYNPDNKPIESSGGRWIKTQKPKIPTSQKILNASTKVSDFFGGKQLSEYVGAKIASSKATPDQKKYITSPTKKQALASAGEVALNFIPGLGAEKTLTKIPKLIKYGKLAAEGAGFLGTQSALSNIAEGKKLTDSGVGKDILKNAAIGAVALPTIAFGGNKLVQYAKNKFGKKVEEVATKKVTPFDNITKPELPLNDKTFNPTIEVNKPSIKVANGAFVETPKVVPSNQQELRALSKQNKMDFIGNEIKFLETTKQKIPSGYQEKLAKTWDKMHPIADTSKVGITPKSNLINKGSIGTDFQNTSLNAVGEVKPPEMSNTTSNIIKPSVEQINSVSNDFIKQNPDHVFISQEGNYNKLIEDAFNNPEQTKLIAEGKIPTPNGIPQNLYTSVIKNIGEEAAFKGDMSYLDNLDLSSSRANLSKGAAEMRASQISSTDNIFDVKYKVESQKFDQLSKPLQEKIKNETDLSAKNLMKHIKDLHNDRGIISWVVDNMKC